MDTKLRDIARLRRRNNWWDPRGWAGFDAVRTERRQLAILSVLGALVFLGAWGVTTSVPQRIQQHQQDLLSSSRDANLAASDLPSELKVRVFNAYTDKNPIELYPWEYMAEPHKPTTMELLDWPVSSDELDYR